MAFSTGSGRGPQADINVTPLVDIVLVLLIIFMVITPMLQRGAEVKLPKAKHAESKEDSGEAAIVSVKEDGSLYLQNDLITEDLLQQQLESILLAEPFKLVLIKGDMKARYGAVRKVMSLCERVGAKTVGLQTDQAELSAEEKAANLAGKGR
jgi:biopolymer transport protein ExbD/biopolymer transport protein TolR